jgi:hypothetical protein
MAIKRKILSLLHENFRAIDIYVVSRYKTEALNYDMETRFGLG